MKYLDNFKIFTITKCSKCGGELIRKFSGAMWFNHKTHKMKCPNK